MCKHARKLLQESKVLLSVIIVKCYTSKQDIMLNPYSVFRKCYSATIIASIICTQKRSNVQLTLVLLPYTVEIFVQQGGRHVVVNMGARLPLT